MFHCIFEQCLSYQYMICCIHKCMSMTYSPFCTPVMQIMKNKFIEKGTLSGKKTKFIIPPVPLIDKYNAIPQQCNILSPFCLTAVHEDIIDHLNVCITFTRKCYLNKGACVTRHDKHVFVMVPHGC